jgi:hypothetical protein
MNFHNSSQSYLRSINQAGVEPQSLIQRLATFPINLSFWKPVGKMLFFILPVVLAVNMYVSSAAGGINQSIIEADNYHHELMDRNIELRAMKAKLRNPGQLQELVAEKLSLYVHAKGQVGKYNRRKGYFIYL